VFVFCSRLFGVAFFIFNVGSVAQNIQARANHPSSLISYDNWICLFEFTNSVFYLCPT
jgi:hypothetical protein